MRRTGLKSLYKNLDPQIFSYSVQRGDSSTLENQRFTSQKNKTNLWIWEFQAQLMVWAPVKTVGSSETPTPRLLPHLALYTGNCHFIFQVRGQRNLSQGANNLKKNDISY